MIRNINAQVELVLNEIKMRYTRGVKFSLMDLSAVISCKNEPNFNFFKNEVARKVVSNGLAFQSEIRNGEKIFKRF